MIRGRNSMRGKLPFTYPRSLVLAPAAAVGYCLTGLVLALLATGCSHDRAIRDPLCGDNLPIPSKTTTPPPPPTAVATGSSTPAEKTKGTPVSSSTGPGLASLTLGGTPGQEKEQSANPPAPVLQPPVTINTPADGSHIVPISTTGADTTYEELQNQLKNLGVVSQSLQKLPNSDQWRFYCAIPVPGGKGFQKVYDETKSGANGLNAIKAALARIKMDKP